MISSAPDKQSVRQAVELLSCASRLLGIKVCYRVRAGKPVLPEEWGLHVVPACLYHKERTLGVCCNFDGYETDRALAGCPDGRIQTCPHGFTEIAVPVMIAGRCMGTLFAGPCWTRKGPPPDPSLIVPPNKDWLPERLLMLRAVAGELGRLLGGSLVHTPKKRQTMIQEYINERLEGAVELQELATRLSLSKSRTSHLVQELFGLPLPLLARVAKLQEAARELVSTDLTIAQISARYGFEDPNYFSRIFRQHYGITARAYRAAYSLQV